METLSEYVLFWNLSLWGLFLVLLIYELHSEIVYVILSARESLFFGVFKLFFFELVCYLE